MHLDDTFMSMLLSVALNPNDWNFEYQGIHFSRHLWFSPINIMKDNTH